MSNKDKKCNALPFITYNSIKGYKIQEEAVKFLKTLPDEDNYSTLTIVGKSKTGKSFLMNQIVQDSNMFPVCSSIDNQNQGIMISTKVIEDGGQKVILLDAGGFGSIQGNDDRDCKLFILSILLSSAVIYNSVGTIDEQSLNNLSMIVEVGKMLEKQIAGPEAFPAMLWVLRDFSLKMEDKDGFFITPKQYLENALSEQKGSSQTVLHKNRIRRIIKALFTERNCQTMVLPTQQIPFEGRGNDLIRPQFEEDLNKMKSRLLKMIHKKGCKDFCGIKMTRDSFIDAAVIYVQALNRSLKDGSLPQIQNITFQLRQSQAKGYISKFNDFLSSKKSEMLHKMISIRKGKDSEQFINQYKKAIVPIEDFYKKTQKNIYELTGQFKEQQLYKIKQLFYQTLEQQTSNKKQIVENNEEEQLCLANICEFFSHITDDNQLQKQYFHEIKTLRERHVNKENIYFSNLLMKLEIAYLRRKVELGKETNFQVDRLLLELQYEKRQVQKLTLRNKQLESKVLVDAKKTQKQNFVTPNKSLQIPEVRQLRNKSQNNGEFSSNTKYFTKEVNCESNTKFESISFYVPYVTIENADFLGTKIIRTLIKQDSRRNSYIQYVIEVNLLDQKWILNRKFKDFSELHSILTMMFQNGKLPQCKAITGCVKLLQSNPQLRKEMVQMRRKQLQMYMQELVDMENIRNSRILQKFLKINKEYTVL